MGMLREMAVKIRTGGKRCLHGIYAVKGTGHNCIGVYEQEIPFHQASHTGFKEPGALHSGDIGRKILPYHPVKETLERRRDNGVRIREQ